ncbi:MAG: Hsp20/alpha crystallin family protein [Anaerolineae bacterium]
MFRSWYSPFDMDAFGVWDPFSEIRSLRRTVDRLFGSPTYYTPTRVSSVSRDFQLDVAERPESFVVQAVLPGLRPEDFDVSIAQDVLTIRAEWPETGEEGVRYLLRERAGGSMERRVRFPLPVEAEQIEAHYENGILTINVPKAESVRPRRITVRSAAPQLAAGRQDDVIEGEARLVED